MRATIVNPDKLHDSYFLSEKIVLIIKVAIIDLSKSFIFL